jgi:hypothetical protein
MLLGELLVRLGYLKAEVIGQLLQLQQTERRFWQEVEIRHLQLEGKLPGHQGEGPNQYLEWEALRKVVARELSRNPNIKRTAFATGYLGRAQPNFLARPALTATPEHSSASP